MLYSTVRVVIWFFSRFFFFYIIIIMIVFLGHLSMCNMLNCAEQAQIQKYKTHTRHPKQHMSRQSYQNMIMFMWTAATKLDAHCWKVSILSSTLVSHAGLEPRLSNCITARVTIIKKNRMERHSLRFLQSPHCAANCLQHTHWSSQGPIVYKSHATHQALTTRATCVPPGMKGQLS